MGKGWTGKGGISQREKRGQGSGKRRTNCHSKKCSSLPICRSELEGIYHAHRGKIIEIGFNYS